MDTTEQDLTITREQAIRLRSVLLHCIGDTRTCQSCRHDFVPADPAQKDAIDMLNELFGSDNSQ